MVAVAYRRDNDQLIDQWRFFRVRGTLDIALAQPTQHQQG